MLKKIEEKITNLTVVKKMVSVLKQHSLWGFDKVPIFYVGKFFKDSILKGTLSTRSASMAFRFFLAIFPGLIFLLTLLPLVPYEGFNDRVIGYLQEVLPSGVKEFTMDTIQDLLNNPRGGVLSLNFVLVLYFSTNGIYTMMQEFNNTTHFAEKRSFFKQQLIALGLTIVLATLLIVSVALITFSGTFIEYMQSKHMYNWINEEWSILAINSAKWIIVCALYYFAIAFLYYFGPANTKSWKFFSAGSSVATILLIIVSLLFSYYVNHFSQYNKIYGSIGTIMIVMLYIYYNSYILLLGFELNASIKKARIEGKILD